MRGIRIVLLFIAAGSLCVAADGAQESDASKATAARAQSAGENTSPAPLAERIAVIAHIQRERKTQFYDELRSLAQQHKQLSEAEYNKKVVDANQKYNGYLRPAADQLMALIKSNRTDPDVLDGLILLQGDMSYSLGVDPLLVEIVLKDQLKSPKMGRLCYLMQYYNNDKVTETILKTVVEKHPLHEVRGQATYALGEYYRQTARDDWGRPMTPEQTASLLASAAKNFEDVIKNFGDVKSPDEKENLGERAATALTRVKNIPILRVGKTAPDVSGEDLDGRLTKLSDYRGKVVVLVYWGSWCGPCMAMVPHERELFERLKGKPFVLLGVNCGDPREKAKETTQSKQMEWPSWWDGGNTDGPIQSAYNVLHWPTVYVLDAQGTIRYTEVSGHELDAAVDELLAKMEPTSSVSGSEPKPNP
jgi:peroxiredoxin